MQPIVDDLSMEIGYRYHSPAIRAEAGTGTSLHEDPRRSKAMPRTRAPHVVLQRTGTPISTLDLFSKNFTVLAGPDGGGWCGAARAAAADLGLVVDAYRLDQEGDLSDPEGRFADAYGVSSSGAVMVRPDGFVGRRAKDASTASKATMIAVLSSLLCRNAPVRPGAATSG
jgi:putative polyketide hydroxylase